MERCPLCRKGTDLIYAPNLRGSVSCTECRGAKKVKASGGGMGGSSADAEWLRKALEERNERKIMEQQQKLETADLLREAQLALAGTPHATLRMALQVREVELRGQVQKVMKFPLHGSPDRKMQEMREAIDRQAKELERALEQFDHAEFDVVAEFREGAAKAAEELASLIRRTR